MFPEVEGDGLKVRPAVHHSRAQTGGSFQILPHMLGEGTE